MAESDASESSITNLVDLSDQIDAVLSQEGGNMCQAEGSLSVGPYNRGGRNEQPGGARLAGGAEVGRYGKLKLPKLLAK